MSELPPAGTFLPDARSNAEAGDALEAFLAFVRTGPGGLPYEYLQINNGAISPTRTAVIVDTQDQAVGIDDLDRIDLAGRPDGSQIDLVSADPNRQIRVRSGQGGDGQIFLSNPAGTGTTLVLSDPTMHLFLQREGNDWYELNRFWGTQSAAQRTYLGLQAGAVMPIASEAETLAASRTDRIVTPGRLDALFVNFEMVLGRRAQVFEFNPGAYVPIGAEGGEVVKITLRDLFQHSFMQSFESVELPCAAGSKGDVPHGLENRPRLMQPILRNKIADRGFNPGDEVLIDGNSASGNTRTLTIGCTPTHVFYTIASPNQLTVVQFSTSSVEAINPSNWRLVIRAFY